MVALPSSWPRPLNQILGEDGESIERLAKLRREPSGLSTGLPGDFDELVGGFHPGQLIALAGDEYSAAGEIALQLVRHSARKLEVPVLVFNLEHNSAGLVLQMLSAESGIDSGRIAGGALSKPAWERVWQSVLDLRRTEIYFWDAPSGSARQLAARALRFQQALLREGRQLGLVVVDTLCSRGRVACREARVLKRLALTLNAPVLALWRLEIPRRREMEPVLADLSGRQRSFPADLVLMPYRDEVYCECSPDRGVVAVYVPRNRYGMQGMRKLGYDRATHRIGEFGEFDDRPRRGRATDVPADRLYVACGEMDWLVDRVREVAWQKFPDGFTLEALLEAAGLDDIEQDILGDIEGRGYLGVWAAGCFFRRLEDRWAFVDLERLGGLLGQPLERAARVLFEREADEPGFCWGMLAGLLACDHRSLYSWGDGTIAGRRWLVRAPGRAGLLGFCFSIEPGRGGRRPDRDWQPLLDISACGPAGPVALAGPVARLRDRAVALDRELLEWLLGIFGDRLEGGAGVELFCRGPRDPVVLVVRGEPRAALMPLG